MPRFSPEEAGILLRPERHGTPDWHKARAKAITGTDVSALMGASKWTTPFDVWCRIVGARKPDEETAFMRWGTLLEPAACEAFEQETQIAVQRNDRLVQHREIEYLVGTPDAWLLDDFRDGFGVLDAKAPSAYTRDEWAEGQAPEFYVWQIHAYMAISGASYGALAAIMPPARHDDPLIVTCAVQRDEEIIAQLEDAVRTFWTRHVVSEVEPDAIRLDARRLLDLHPEDEPRTVRLDAETSKRLDEREKLLAEAKRMEAQAQDIAAVVKQRMGSAAFAVSDDGQRAFSWRTNKRSVRTFKEIKGLPKAAPTPPETT